MSETTQTIKLDQSYLLDKALSNQEIKLAHNGAVVAKTGVRTGRSPQDRFIVKDTENQWDINWGSINQPMSPETFKRLWDKAHDHMRTCSLYQSNMAVGSDKNHQIKVQVTTEFAWHHLFLKHLFIQEDNPLPTSRTWQLISLPGCLLDPNQDGCNSDGAVAIHLAERRVLICGMRYAGEMKKSLFSVMNFLMPKHDVLPMHCSANIGKDGDTALFFGLSGTGKTTLSADTERMLIGDDEHGWSSSGVFNFEGGCYAKCIKLSEKDEPMIYKAIQRHTILENVVLDQQNKPLFSDDSITANTRAAYPRDFIPNCEPSNMGKHPRSVIFLSCDLYGVLPPVSLLSLDQAIYYFLNGYTALVGSTEIGSSDTIKPTFSTCFGAPFFPRPPKVYAELLKKRLLETHANVYLINTGWTGGGYNQGGKRFSIPVTRRVVAAALSGEILTKSLEILPGFNLKIPQSIDGVDPQCLNPSTLWSNQEQYRQNANLLIQQFTDNFSRMNYDLPLSDLPSIMT